MPLEYFQATTENDVEAESLHNLELSRADFMSRSSNGEGVL